jgi:hypothetical protein
MRKLTIGMATHDDYDGLYFSIQSIRMFHKEILDDLEFVIVDNNPNEKHGDSIRKFIKWIKEPVQYLPFTKYKSSTIKNKVFELADTPYVLCMDSHVLIEPKALKKLIKLYDSGKDEGNLLQGPLVYDNMTSISTHFNLDVWSDCMWGQWGTDPRGTDPKNPPFEIPAQGMGLFSCRKDTWPGFNKDFRGFGGEEGYIHEKFKQKGKKTLCVPFLRWVHRFERPNGISYPNKLEERFRNYYIGFKELKMDTTNLVEHFKKHISSDYINTLISEIT